MAKNRQPTYTVYEVLNSHTLQQQLGPARGTYTDSYEAFIAARNLSKAEPTKHFTSKQEA